MLSVSDYPRGLCAQYKWHLGRSDGNFTLIGNAVGRTLVQDLLPETPIDWKLLVGAPSVWRYNCNHGSRLSRRYQADASRRTRRFPAAAIFPPTNTHFKNNKNPSQLATDRD